MASFEEAYAITKKIEGGYVNDPNDIGGETYCGIARNYHPGWEGWKIIDEAKEGLLLIAEMERNPILALLVRRFFKDTFWDVFLGDKIPYQTLANELFDTGVNQGVNTAIKYLQEALNFLNNNQSLYPDLVVDGVFGNKTYTILTTHFKEYYKGGYGIQLLLKIMNILQGYQYLEAMRKSPIQEKYARGWLERVEITKTFSA